MLVIPVKFYITCRPANVSGVIFVSTDSGDDTLLLYTVVAAWKLLIIILLTSAISGIFMWLMVNKIYIID